MDNVIRIIYEAITPEVEREKGKNWKGFWKASCRYCSICGRIYQNSDFNIFIVEKRFIGF